MHAQHPFISLDVHFEAIHDHGDRGYAGADVGGGQGALVDGAELPHDPVQEQKIVGTHPHSGSEIQRGDYSLGSETQRAL